MFTNDSSEIWDSSEFQDSFIKDYFGNRKVSKVKAKDGLSPTDNFGSFRSRKDLKDTFGNLQSDSGEASFKSNPSNTKHALNSSLTGNVKKKRKLSNNQSEDKFIKNHTNSSELNEVKLGSSTDSSSLNSKKKRKRRPRNKKNKALAVEQTTLNSAHHETLKPMNDGEELQISKEETDSVSNHSLEKKSLYQNKLHQKLQGAKFRYLNELLYTSTGKDALSYFQDNKEEFQDYHSGYQSQVSKWPINPVDIIIEDLFQINKQNVIADLGCGEAKIAEAFPNRTVHSFDLIALKDCVTACDIANVPLPSGSVDVVVFCLSLMGTNWKDYLKEGHRILKSGAMLKIAEIESRVEDLKGFIKHIEAHGFSLVNKDLSHKMFIFLNFKKVKNKVKNSKITNVTLKPCLYKKR